MPTQSSVHTPWGARDLLTLAACFVPAAIFTWGIHEFAHWLTGEALGYDMWITFNQVGLVDGGYDSAWHQHLVTMSGPLVTLAQGFAALGLVRWSRKLWTYSFLFLTFWTRAVATGISYAATPNDEARVSLSLGLPMWVLPSVFVLILLTLTYFGSRHLRAGWKANAISYVMASVVTAAIVFSDQLLFNAR